MEGGGRGKHKVKRQWKTAGTKKCCDSRVEYLQRKNSHQKTNCMGKPYKIKSGKLREDKEERGSF